MRHKVSISGIKKDPEDHCRSSDIKKDTEGIFCQQLHVNKFDNFD